MIGARSPGADVTNDGDCATPVTTSLDAAGPLDRHGADLGPSECSPITCRDEGSCRQPLSETWPVERLRMKHAKGISRLERCGWYPETGIVAFMLNPSVHLSPLPLRLDKGSSHAIGSAPCCRNLRQVVQAAGWRSLAGRPMRGMSGKRSARCGRRRPRRPRRTLICRAGRSGR